MYPSSKVRVEMCSLDTDEQNHSLNICVAFSFFSEDAERQACEDVEPASTEDDEPVDTMDTHETPCFLDDCYWFAYQSTI